MTRSSETPRVEIRRAEEEDLPAILALYAQPGMDDGNALALPDAHRIFARMKSYPNYHLYVAEVDGEIVGTFALLIMDNLAHLGAPSGILEDVVVHPALQGRGVGGQMVRFAMDLCREASCYKLVLSSNVKRTEGHAFYERLGLRKHGYSFVVELPSRA
jgi:ribosomal protein S18 acetylase RimI-like enzyme